LHDALKEFSIPTEFVGQINGRGEIIPERIDSLFRDESELPGEADLSADVRQALETIHLPGCGLFTAFRPKASRE